MDASLKQRFMCLGVVAVILYICVDLRIPQNFMEENTLPDMSAMSMLRIKGQKGNLLSYTEAGMRQADRLNLLKKACQESDLFKKTIYKGNPLNKTFYSQNFNIAYCKVPKVASTFWIRVFLILETEEKNRWLTMMKSMQVHSQRLPLIVPFHSKNLLTSRTIIVTRNPYSRLYSAYVDKIVLPPHLFQTRLHLQPKLSNDSQCTEPASFSQFLHAVIKQALAGSVLNGHWAPIFSLCQPCNSEYVHPIILKLESFSEDFDYILDAINVDENRTQFLKNVLQDNREDSSAQKVIHKLDNIVESRSCEAALIWRILQIRGYIDATVDFPAGSLTRDDEWTPQNLTRLVNQSILHETQRRDQRRSFLVNAYRSIDKETIHYIQKIFHQDFLLFGYSLEPPK